MMAGKSMKMKTIRLFVSVVVLLWLSGSFAQEKTVGVLLHDERAFDGLTLFAPFGVKTTYLIDNEGRLVHSWESDFFTGLSEYLLEDGTLLRGGDTGDTTYFNRGGKGTVVQRLDWDSNVLWQFEYSDSTRRRHHDIEPMPNGNVLIIAWELKSVDEVIAAGGDTSQLADGTLWPDHIIEVKPQGFNGGEIVWEWHVWDHLIQDFDSTKANFGVVAEHPELINLNFFPFRLKDWNHLNSVNYNPALDQIILSCPRFGELWIIDHSTTTAEAAGHSGGNSGMGGDLIYRWGNPQQYGHGTEADQKLFFQHDPHWIKPGLQGEGHILIFNNGRTRPDVKFSRIEEIVPPLLPNGLYERLPGSPFGPTESVWSYESPNKTDFYAPFVSGAQRMQNGNTLICSGSNGRFFEVTNAGEIVWEYINPVTTKGIIAQGDTIPDGAVHGAFRCTRYSRDYPGFNGQDLTPGNPLEGFLVSVETDPVPVGFTLFQNYPNPFNPATTIRYDLDRRSFVTIQVYNLNGQLIKTLVASQKKAGQHVVSWDGTDAANRPVASGIYFYSIKAGDFYAAKKMSLIK